ncbi:hypothetical protein Pmani_002942 [Petrolisthes manimaculis]|uniref:Secreted protein n=1 Tax=Petrolisthes manimaculis TaxID=1843537 RepID=A0AAE1UQH5_9EUCA|nr:hypothetical protein Pmani_002942 [Petrolisthes manimaculis]
MRPSSCSPALSGSMVVLTGLVLLMVVAAPPTLAKRFDCRMFCRSTGFTGMVGGCRCSFTLFTAKRSVRDHMNNPEHPDVMTDSATDEEGRYLSVADLVQQMTKGSPATLNNAAPHSLQADYRITQEEVAESPAAPHTLPENHPMRVLMVKNNGSSATHRTHQQQHQQQLRIGQSPSQVLLKRKEFEQDLDNGDTSDFLRLPY